MINFIIAGIVLIVGLADELKMFFQYKKIRQLKTCNSISRRTMIISIFCKFVVFIFALYKHQWFFAILYVTGLVTNYKVVQEIYRLSRIKNKNPINFIKRAFHVKTN